MHSKLTPTLLNHSIEVRIVYQTNYCAGFIRIKQTCLIASVFPRGNMAYGKHHMPSGFITITNHFRIGNLHTCLNFFCSNGKTLNCFYNSISQVTITLRSNLFTLGFCFFGERLLDFHELLYCGNAPDALKPMQ